MRTGAPGVVKCLVSGLVIVLALVGTGRTADSAVGQVIHSVDIPDDALCGEVTSGTAVAMVQGSKVGAPDVPVVLVTSCNSFSGEIPQARLFFIDPDFPGNGGPETVRPHLNTSVTPANGWAALTLRADSGDLLACTPTATGTDLYTIDISIFNNIADGTATLLRSGPAGSTCDGIAWDVSDKTIFQTSNTNSILHYTATGTNLTSIESGCGTDTIPAGLSVAGPSLFVGCVEPPDIITLTSPATKLAATPRARPAAWDAEDAFVPSELKDFVRSMGVVLAQNGEPAPPSKIRQLNKAVASAALNLNLVREIATGDIALLDLKGFACDAATFGQSSRDALWVKDGSSPEIRAVEIPAGTCSLSGTIPLLASPGACPANYPTNNGLPLDTDGDGLLDCWEDGALWTDGNPGIDFDGDGTRDIVLCVESNSQAGFQAADCADKNMKDVFVEFDSMAQHAPITTQLTEVVTAFLNAPVPNPSGTDGIKLRIQIGDQNIPHANNTAIPPCTPPAATGDADFDTLKRAWFGTAAERAIANVITKEKTLSAKKLAFRYGLSVHNLTRPANTASPSGCAEVPGNDFVLALGSFGSGIHRAGVGTQQYWGGTFMHELGHNLGLRHGGGNNDNCKPNYLSIMSYPRQFKTVITDRPLDYSRVELPTLTEGGLAEADGVGLAQVPAGAKTTFGTTATGSNTTSTARIATPATGPISWDGDTNAGENVSININFIASVSGCDGAGTTLFGYDDWANLVYNFRATIDFADGSYQSMDEVKEVTEPQVQDLSQAVDADGDGVKDVNSCGGAACAIDIVPGLSNNKVLLFKLHGVPTSIIPVALLSSTVFNATLVDPHTLTFANTPVSQLRGRPVCANLDVNRDKRRDLVCTFVVTGLEPGEQTAILDGMSFDTAIRAEGIMLVVRVPQDDDD